MNPRADRLLAIGIIVIALVVAGSFIASNWTASVPAGAASVPIARTTLTGPIDPDPAPEAEVASMPPSPSGQQCLGRMTNGAGYLDLCWQVWRAADADPTKDYYTLRLHGTVGGSGSGIRWWALRADLAGEPGDNVLIGWPSGTYDSPCAQQAVPDRAGNDAEQSAVICRRTTGRDVPDWAYSVQWTCVGCLLPDHSDREVALFMWVGVAQGTVPTWDIGADFGG